MYRFALAALCFLCGFILEVQAQNTSVEPISVAAGTILTFHLQTRLNPTGGNETDILPRGTVLKVKMLDAIDSGIDRDGSAFRGEVVSPVVSGNEVVVHADSEVTGLLALLRSRNHPEGFRYELLITKVSDHGKSYDLTASLNPSFADVGTEHAAGGKSEGSNGLK
jgi:hypothetical protein